MNKTLWLVFLGALLMFGISLVENRYFYFQIEKVPLLLFRADRITGTIQRSSVLDPAHSWVGAGIDNEAGQASLTPDLSILDSIMESLGLGGAPPQAFPPGTRGVQGAPGGIQPDEAPPK